MVRNRDDDTIASYRYSINLFVAYLEAENEVTVLTMQASDFKHASSQGRQDTSSASGARGAQPVSAAPKARRLIQTCFCVGDIFFLAFQMTTANSHHMLTRG